LKKRTTHRWVVRISLFLAQAVSRAKQLHEFYCEFGDRSNVDPECRPIADGD
jgi:hypothetical protein